LLEIVREAGWPIWLLVATSVLGLALIIERLLSLRQSLVIPPRLASQVMEMIRQNGDTPEALTRLADNSPLGRILAEVLLHRDDSEQARINAAEEAGKDVAYRLYRYLPALATISVVAPLLGLFGTVVGMIEIFGAQNASGTNPAQLAHGISVALYNTGFGLAIAMPTLVFYRHFRALVDSFIVDMEQQAVKFVDTVHSNRK
jgi:biopolymer transport protein ExbB